MADAPYASMLGLVIMFSLAGLAGDSEVPIECQSHDTLRTTMCAAEVRIAALTHLCDDDVSVLAVELAAAPTFAILDDVIATSPPSRVVALTLRGDLYITMAVRMRHAGASQIRVAGWLVSARRAYSDARILEVGLRGAPPPAEETNP